MNVAAKHTSSKQPASESDQAERMGKWTQEEVTYLEALIMDFKDGALEIPIQEGETLRAFLAEQLGCGVKRISKRMEGTKYNGRLRYAPNPGEREERKARLQRLKEAFLLSLQPEDAETASKKRKNESVVPTGNPPKKYRSDSSKKQKSLAASGNQGFLSLTGSPTAQTSAPPLPQRSVGSKKNASPGPTVAGTIPSPAQLLLRSLPTGVATTPGPVAGLQGTLSGFASTGLTATQQQQDVLRQIVGLLEPGTTSGFSSNGLTVAQPQLVLEPVSLNAGLLRVGALRNPVATAAASLLGQTAIVPSAQLKASLDRALAQELLRRTLLGGGMALQSPLLAPQPQPQLATPQQTLIRLLSNSNLR